MSFLSRKIFLFIISSFIIFVYTFFLPIRVQAQNNPWDVFNSSTNECDQEELQLRKEELNDPNKAKRISDCRIYRREAGAKIQAFNYLLGGPTIDDPLFKDDQKGAIPFIGKTIAMLYAVPPASGIYYAYDFLNHAGLVEPAYAQGIGFAGLTPFLSLWKASRNIAYGILIIVMVAIGFMIIFRMKIDPKTVISLQAALPKIVLTLIIITLSYPIVGFLIDIMYLSMSMIISLILNGVGGTMWGKDIAAWQTEFMTADIGDLGGSVFSGGTVAVGNVIWNAVGGSALVGSSGILLLLAVLPVHLLSAWFTLVPAGILILLLLLGALFTFIRLLLLLVNSYIQLLISLILGPLLLLQEAIPGKSAFTEWILNVMANLVVFPATVAIFLFASVILYIGQNTTSFWAPPFIGIGSNSGAGNMFSGLLSLGIIFLAPNLVAQIKKAFHPKPTIPFTAGTAIAPLTGGVQTAMGAASQFYYLQHTPIINRLFGGKPGQTG